MPKNKVIETDVLVIGGGIAGCFAAIKAKDQKVKVTLVDKGYTGRSGMTPFAHGFAVLNPEWGNDLNAVMEQINYSGDSLNNRDWTEIVFKNSYDRYQDLVSWGVEFARDENGEINKSGAPGSSVCGSVSIQEYTPAMVFREQTLKSGATIMDRIMIVELLKQGKKVAGAVGISVDSDDLYIFKSKATVICGGAGAFKPAGRPVSALTADAEAMAYRVGAEITGKEFVSEVWTNGLTPWSQGTGLPKPNPKKQPQMPMIANGEGKRMSGHSGNFGMALEVHQGRGPITMTTGDGVKSPIVGGAVAGAAHHKGEGIWPANKKCGTSVPGLYAAGDCLGTMQCGASYSIAGSSMLGSAVTGAIAGTAAAKYASHEERPNVSDKELERLKNIVLGPIGREGGFSPKWVTQNIQNAMIPYFVLDINEESRMQASLTMIEFIRDHLVPKLLANDQHELRHAHETRNMVYLAEAKLRASLFRTESRGRHYREDYPQRDDDNWMAWVLLKEEGGKMKVFRKPIPDEWRVDLSRKSGVGTAPGAPGADGPPGRGDGAPNGRDGAPRGFGTE